MCLYVTTDIGDGSVNKRIRFFGSEQIFPVLGSQSRIRLWPVLHYLPYIIKKIFFSEKTFQICYTATVTEQMTKYTNYWKEVIQVYKTYFKPTLKKKDSIKYIDFMPNEIRKPGVISSNYTFLILACCE